MSEKQDRRAITINNKQNANIKHIIREKPNITWFTQDGLCPHKNCQSFYYTIQQNEGIQPTTTLIALPINSLTIIVLAIWIIVVINVKRILVMTKE